MDGLKYWWKAGPGPYARRVLVGLGWGILIIMAGVATVGFFAFTGQLALALAEGYFLSDPTIAFAIWAAIMISAIVIGAAIRYQFKQNPIERRKQPGDDRYGAEYDPYNRENDEFLLDLDGDFDEETLEFKPQKTRHVGIYQSQINIKDSSQRVE